MSSTRYLASCDARPVGCRVPAGSGELYKRHANRKESKMFALLALFIFLLVKLVIWSVIAMVWICGAVLFVFFVLPFKIIIGIMDRA